MKKDLNFYEKNVNEIARYFDVDTQKGLSSKEVQKRQALEGKNKLPESLNLSALRILIAQFLSPFMFILLIAAVASFVVGKYNDAIVIGLAVIFNVILGFIQEWKAESTAEKLKNFEEPKCKVCRDGNEFTIDAKDLVPGDIVLLFEGDKVPADLRLIKSVDLIVDESLLTGEAEPSKKHSKELQGYLNLGDQKNIAFMGTFILHGRAEGIVIRTGVATELGRIASYVLTTKKKETPIQYQLKRFSLILGGSVFLISALIFLIGYLKKIDFIDLFSITIALFVAAIPEGLLIGVTITFAIGIQRMLKRKALIKKLIAAETLGNVSVICTDKTGTLTKGKLSVVRVATLDFDVDFKSEFFSKMNDLFLIAVLNNDASIDKYDGEKRVGEPTEIALLEAAFELGLDISDVRSTYQRINEIPFSSDLKYMATLHSFGSLQLLLVKGAPEVIFDMCNLTEVELEKLKSIFDNMTSDGLRVLAFASLERDILSFSDDLKNLQFIGLIGMKDELRPQAINVVNELKNAGVKVVLITGDHIKTARSIAQSAGIFVDGHGVLTGEYLEGKSESDLQRDIADIDVFARVNPIDKVRIVEAWKSRGESVAMIGDGVNDSPALKIADIGVALGSGSDLSHEVADMVLLDDNLSTIEAAVYEGRVIFDNIRKIIVYLLVDSFSEVILIGLAILFGYSAPLTAVQILWINLISDGFLGSALTLEGGEPQIMDNPPRPKDTPILNKEMKFIIFFTGILTDVFLFTLYLFLNKTGFDLLHIRSIIFTSLAINSLFFIFSVRSLKRSVFKMNPFSNRWIVVAVLFGFILQLAVIYIPHLQSLFSTVALSFRDWLIVLPISLIKLVGIELTKIWFVKSDK